MIVRASRRDAHHEGEQEQEVDDPDPARDGCTVEVEQREDEERPR